MRTSKSRMAVVSLSVALAISNLPAFTGTAAAQSETRGLFREAQAIPAQQLRAGQRGGVGRSRLVEIDRSQLRRLGSGRVRRGEVVLLNLFPDVEYIGLIDRVEDNATGGRTLYARLGTQAEGTAVLVVRGNTLAGHVTVPEAHYVVSPLRRGTHLVYQLDESQLPREAPPIWPQRSEFIPAPAGYDLAAADDGSTIDILAVYTPNARVNGGGQSAVESAIQSAIAWTNQSYSRSDINPRLNLVHMEEISYVESPSGMSTDLDRLTSTTDGFIDSVHALRDAVGADLVALITEASPFDYCGIAWFAAHSSGGIASYGFSVTDGRCLPATFAHELGHNQGAHHDRYVAGSSGAFSYSYGYVDLAAQFRTIMAYRSLCNDAGVSCPRIQNFSNPLVSYNGAPTGVSSGQPNSADNGKTLDNTAYTVANFRNSLLPVAPDLVAPADGSTTSDTTPDFVFDVVPGATEYYLRVSEPSAPVHGLWYDAAGICSSGTCTVTDVGPLNSGTHNWRVRAKNAVGSGPFSEWDSFTVSSGPPAAPTLVSPPPGTRTADATPSFVFNAVASATQYFLRVSEPTAQVHGEWYSAASICSGATCTVNDVGPLNTRRHNWRVRAKNSGGAGPYSPWRPLTIDPGPPAAPVLVSPAADATINDTTPDFVFQEVAGATKYFLRVSMPTLAVHGKWYTAASICSAGTCTVTDVPALDLSRHNWRVRARNGAGTSGPFSAWQSFTVE